MDMNKIVPTLDGVEVDESLTIGKLIEMNVDIMEESYKDLENNEELTTPEQCDFYMTTIRNTLLKEMLLGLCVRPVYADEIIAIVDDKTEHLYNEF